MFRASNVCTAPDLLAEVLGRLLRLTAEVGCDAEWRRTDLRETVIEPVIPGLRGR